MIVNEKDYIYTFGAGNLKSLNTRYFIIICNYFNVCWIFFKGDSGQCGRGSLNHNMVPREVFFNQEIKRINAISANWVK